MFWIPAATIPTTVRREVFVASFVWIPDEIMEEIEADPEVAGLLRLVAVMAAAAD